MYAKNVLISVIMSVYNESYSDLKQSIESILNQTYRNIELIIINDNPENQALKASVKEICNNDARVLFVENEKNMGLVASLNHALQFVKGEYVARMDADDISFPQRLSEQKRYMEEMELDLVGAYIQTIDEAGIVIKDIMKFPANNKDIYRFMKWGNCIPHPTWFGKTEIFKQLHGYRQARHCEDYEFLLRTLESGYKVGNYPDVLLKYRIRNTGISVSNAAEQYVLRRFLAKKRKEILLISEENIQAYRESVEFQEEQKKYSMYHDAKLVFKKKKKAVYIARFVANKYFYFDLKEKLMRELGAK